MHFGTNVKSAKPADVVVRSARLGSILFADALKPFGFFLGPFERGYHVSERLLLIHAHRLEGTLPWDIRYCQSTTAAHLASVIRYAMGVYGEYHSDLTSATHHLDPLTCAGQPAARTQKTSEGLRGRQQQC